MITDAKIRKWPECRANGMDCSGAGVGGGQWFAPVPLPGFFPRKPCRMLQENGLRSQTLTQKSAQSLTSWVPLGSPRLLFLIPSMGKSPPTLGSFRVIRFAQEWPELGLGPPLFSPLLQHTQHPPSPDLSSPLTDESMTPSQERLKSSWAGCFGINLPKRPALSQAARTRAGHSSQSKHQRE